MMPWNKSAFLKKRNHDLDLKSWISLRIGIYFKVIQQLISRWKHQDRDGSAFPSSCRVQPCATPMDGMENKDNKDNKDIPPPIYEDNKDVIPPYVGHGSRGRPLGQNRTDGLEFRICTRLQVLAGFSILHSLGQCCGKPSLLHSIAYRGTICWYRYARTVW
jgi:hypothetical protein